MVMVVLMLQWERFLFVFISRITKSLAISWNFFPHTIVVVVLISNNIPLSLRNFNNKTTTNQNSFNAPQLLWIFLLHIILSTTQKQSCNKVICVNNLSHTCIGYEISEFQVWRLCLSFFFFFFLQHTAAQLDRFILTVVIHKLMLNSAERELVRISC